MTPSISLRRSSGSRWPRAKHTSYFRSYQETVSKPQVFVVLHSMRYSRERVEAYGKTWSIGVVVCQSD
jgi:hypothetical protein